MRSFTIKRSTVKRVCLVVLTLIFQIITYFSAHAQGQVGIGTSNPQAKLHVAGNLRVDSLPVSLITDRIATVDDSGILRTLSFDSLRNRIGNQSGGNATVFSQEVSAQGSTTSSTAQSRVTLTLPPGNYLLFAYAEIFNTTAIAGVRMWLFEGSTEIGYSMPYSNTSTYGSWSSFRYVSITTSTVITLSYSTWPAGSLSYIRRARLAALKL